MIVDIAVTTGETNEGAELVPAIEPIEALTGVHVATATADAGSAYAKVYGALERRRTDAVIPLKAEPIRSKVPMRRFRYDAKHDLLKFPRGKILKAGRAVKHGRFFTSRAKDCRDATRPRCACRAAARTRPWCSVTIIRRCSRRAAAGSTGPSATSIFIAAIAGVLRVRMVKRRAGTVSRAPFGVASVTCRSKPT